MCGAVSGVGREWLREGRVGEMKGKEGSRGTTLGDYHTVAVTVPMCECDV